MSIINISVVIDAQYVVATFGPNNNSESPPGFYHENIYLTVRGGDAVQSDASGWLVMRAKSESDEDIDRIRWRAEDISLGADHQCRITKLNFQRGANLITAPKQRRLGRGENGHRIDCFWEVEVLEPGAVQYNIEFMVIDGQGRVQGYYTYDPLIQIS